MCNLFGGGVWRGCSLLLDETLLSTYTFYTLMQLSVQIRGLQVIIICIVLHRAFLISAYIQLTMRVMLSICFVRYVYMLLVMEFDLGRDICPPPPSIESFIYLRCQLCPI